MVELRYSVIFQAVDISPVQLPATTGFHLLFSKKHYVDLTTYPVVIID
jgi:hypothetical protein